MDMGIWMKVKVNHLSREGDQETGQEKHDYYSHDWCYSP